MSHQRLKKTSHSDGTGGAHLHYDRVLDFHGYFPDKAILELEEVIFSTPIHSAILVIHGMGAGVLKQSVRSFICSSKLIASYEYGEEANLPGGAGVVLVYT